MFTRRSVYVSVFVSRLIVTPIPIHTHLIYIMGLKTKSDISFCGTSSEITKDISIKKRLQWYEYI